MRTFINDNGRLKEIGGGDWSRAFLEQQQAAITDDLQHAQNDLYDTEELRTAAVAIVQEQLDNVNLLLAKCDELNITE